MLDDYNYIEQETRQDGDGDGDEEGNIVGLNSRSSRTFRFGGGLPRNLRWLVISTESQIHVPSNADGRMCDMRLKGLVAD